MKFGTFKSCRIFLILSDVHLSLDEKHNLASVPTTTFTNLVRVAILDLPEWNRTPNFDKMRARSERWPFHGPILQRNTHTYSSHPAPPESKTKPMKTSFCGGREKWQLISFYLTWFEFCFITSFQNFLKKSYTTLRGQRSTLPSTSKLTVTNVIFTFLSWNRKIPSESQSMWV